jgi:hypothetical protein
MPVSTRGWPRAGCGGRSARCSSRWSAVGWIPVRRLSGSQCSLRRPRLRSRRRPLRASSGRRARGRLGGGQGAGGARGDRRELARRRGRQRARDSCGRRGACCHAGRGPRRPGARAGPTPAQSPASRSSTGRPPAPLAPRLSRRLHERGVDRNRRDVGAHALADGRHSREALTLIEDSEAQVATSAARLPVSGRAAAAPARAPAVGGLALAVPEPPSFAHSRVASVLPETAHEPLDRLRLGLPGLSEQLGAAVEAVLPRVVLEQAMARRPVRLHAQRLHAAVDRVLDGGRGRSITSALAFRLAWK